MTGFFGFERDVFESSVIAFFFLEESCEVGFASFVFYIEENRDFFFEVDVRSTDFTGLSCRINKILNIYLLDSNLFWLYVERLGASSVVRVKEFVTIVDVKEEFYYILDFK